MDKTSEKVTKDPRRVERGKKSHKMYMKRIKEKILEDNQLPTLSTFSSTGEPTPSTSSSTGDPTPSTCSQYTRPIDTYVCGVGCLWSLPLVFVYCLHITLFNLKIKNLSMKKRINHQNDVICFRKIYNK